MTTSTPTARDTSLQPLLHQVAFTRMFINKLAEDLKDEETASQSEGVINHPAWCLAHIAVAQGTACTYLNIDPVVPDQWREDFGPGSNPTPVRDNYPSRDQVLTMLNKQFDGLTAALERATPEQLDAPTPHEMLAQFAPTIRDALYFFLTSHTHFHLGQIASWRAAHEYPRALG